MSAKNQKEELEDFVGGTAQDFSTKLSKNSRYLTWALLGTMWALLVASNSKDELGIRNPFTYWSFGACISFLIVDVFQYLFITIYYNKKREELDSISEGNSKEIEQFRKEIDKFAYKTFWVVYLKTVICLASVVFFGIAIVKSNLFDSPVAQSKNNEVELVLPNLVNSNRLILNADTKKYNIPELKSNDK